MKTKSNKCSFPISFVFGLIAFTIIFFSIILFKNFNNKITPNLLSVAEASIDKLNATILTNYRVKDIYPQVSLEDAIHIAKNNKDEIISVDFDLENIYKALSIITVYLQNNLENMDVRNQVLGYYNDELSSGLDSIILAIPIGVASKGIYMANLGPKIPVKVSYMGYVSSSVRIKLQDYGINNVLISIFIDCFITNEFIAPITYKQVSHEYNILIASKIIQGIVPEYYGGVMEAKSNILNIPIQ